MREAFALSSPFVTNVCKHNSSYILNEYSSKLCMLAYYYMKICMSLWQFSHTISERVVALFDFLKRYVVRHLGDNLVVFFKFYLRTSEIWPDKRVAFGGSGFIRGGLLY